MQVLITVSFVLKLIGTPVLTQLSTGPKKYRFSVPIPSLIQIQKRRKYRNIYRIPQISQKIQRYEFLPYPISWLQGEGLKIRVLDDVI